MAENIKPFDLGRTAGLLRTGFHAAVDGNEAAVSLSLEGELNVSTAPALGWDLSTAFDSIPQTITLDLSELTFLDSTGLRLLVSASLRAWADGCAFILRSPQATVLRLLQSAGVDRHMVIETSHSCSAATAGARGSRGRACAAVGDDAEPRCTRLRPRRGAGHPRRAGGGLGR